MREFLFGVNANYGPVAADNRHPERAIWSSEGWANEKIIQIAKQSAPPESKETVEKILKDFVVNQ